LGELNPGGVPELHFGGVSAAAEKMVAEGHEQPRVESQVSLHELHEKAEAQRKKILDLTKQVRKMLVDR
jgi:hypothetical protein